jgi:hypothetical protein
MKRLLCTSVIAVGVLAAVLAGGAAATGGGVTKYKVSYDDQYLFGATTCSGAHLDGTAASAGQDVFYCTISNRLQPGTIYTEDDFGWCSDYFGQPAVMGDCVEASSFRIRVAGVGLSIVGQAVY